MNKNNRLTLKNLQKGTFKTLIDNSGNNLSSPMQVLEGIQTFDKNGNLITGTLTDPQPLKDEIVALSEEIAGLEGKISENEAEIERLNGEIVTLNGRISELDEQVAEQGLEILQLEGEVERLESRIIVLQSENAALQSEVERLNGIVASQESTIASQASEIAAKNTQIESLQAETERMSNVQAKTITENGVYTPDEGFYAMSEVVVDVQGGGGECPSWVKSNISDLPMLDALYYNQYRVPSWKDGKITINVNGWTPLWSPATVYLVSVYYLVDGAPRTLCSITLKPTTNLYSCVVSTAIPDYWKFTVDGVEYRAKATTALSGMPSIVEFELLDPVHENDVPILYNTVVATYTVDAVTDIPVVNCVMPQGVFIQQNGTYEYDGQHLPNKVNVNVAPNLLWKETPITENGEYTKWIDPEIIEGGYYGYAAFTVNVPQPQPVFQTKTVTENGTVTPDEGYDGLSRVVVNVQGGDCPDHIDVDLRELPLYSESTAYNRYRHDWEDATERTVVIGGFEVVTETVNTNLVYLYYHDPATDKATSVGYLRRTSTGGFSWTAARVLDSSIFTVKINGAIVSQSKDTVWYDECPTEIVIEKGGDYPIIYQLYGSSYFVYQDIAYRQYVLNGVVPSTVEITENGTHEMPEGKLANKVIVDVHPDVNLQDKVVDVNGIVSADEGYDGLGTVTVNVPQEGDTSLDLVNNMQGTLSILSNNATSVRDFCFCSMYMSGFSMINLPSASFCGARAFAYNWVVDRAYLPAAQTIGLSCFQACSNLTTVFLENCQIISANAFIASPLFGNLILSGSIIPALANPNTLSNGTMFKSGGGGAIYVPASMLSDYQNAPFWSTFASNFIPVQDSEWDGLKSWVTKIW